MKKLLGMTSALVFAGMAAQASTIQNSAGLDLSEGASVSSDLQVFAEQSNVTVDAGDVTVDYLVGSNLAVGDDFTGLNTNGNGLGLTAGTYDSYMLHYDTAAASTLTDVTVSFDTDIVAIILSNVGGGSLLNLSDAVFGDASAFDTTNGRRAESSDLFTLTASNTLVVDRLIVGAPYTDNIRVLTVAAEDLSAVPVPASMPLLLAGFAGLVALRRKS